MADFWAGRYWNGRFFAPRYFGPSEAPTATHYVDCHVVIIGSASVEATAETVQSVPANESYGGGIAKRIKPLPKIKAVAKKSKRKRFLDCSAVVSATCILDATAKGTVSGSAMIGGRAHLRGKAETVQTSTKADNDFWLMAA